MATTFILAASLALQFLAAILAFRLLRFTGRRAAWGLIVAALALMVMRRAIPFYRELAGTPSVLRLDPVNELFGLVLSFLMAAGIAAVAPLFVAAVRSEEALKSSEERLSLHLRQTMLGVIEWDSALRVREWNSAAEAIFGCGRNEALHQHAAHLNIPREIVGHLGAVRDALPAQSGGEYATSAHTTQDGRAILCEWFNASLVDSGGRPIGVISLVRDVTEQRRVEGELQRNERALRVVADNTYDWEFWLAPDGRFLYCSPSCSRMTGHTVDEFVADPALHQRIVHPDDQGLVGRHLQEARDRLPCGEIEFRILHRDGSVRWVGHVCQPVFDEHGAFLGRRGSNRDITQRKQAEDAVRIRARQFDALRSVSAEITRELDLTTLLVLINRRAGELVGVDSGVVWLWNEQSRMLTPRAWHGFGEWMREIRLRLGEGVSGMAALRRQGMVVNDYRTSPYALPALVERTGIHAVIAEPLLYHDRLIGVIAIDNQGDPRSFTMQDQEIIRLFADHAAIAIENARLFEEVRTGHDRLQALSRRLVEVQEAERRHIARELHDEIGQSLTALKFRLELSAGPPPARVHAGFEEARVLVQEMMTRVRELSLNLRPAVLDDLGLLPALMWHCERYRARTNIQVACLHTGVEGHRFAPEVETVAYRIVQEALTNVARHAGVADVTVRVWLRMDRLGVQIEDHGQGFDLEAVLAGRASSGVIGMRERAELLGGDLTIEASPGAGTRITAEFPLDPPAEEGMRHA